VVAILAVILPFPASYALTVPSILFDESKAIITGCPTAYARDVPITSIFVPVPIVSDVLDVVVYTSPGRPLYPLVDAPLIPEYPLLPEYPLTPLYPDAPL
jgi:hypothetical protein